MPRSTLRDIFPHMPYRTSSSLEIEGFPGWTWRALAAEDLPLAWPLARLAGVATDLGAWRRLAERWLALAAIEGGGLGALVNPGGLFVALERHRPSAVAGAPALAVVWHRVLEVTPLPRCLEALLEATSTLARRAGCRVLEIAPGPDEAERFARLAGRLGLVACGDRWLRALDPELPATANGAAASVARPPG